MSYKQEASAADAEASVESLGSGSTEQDSCETQTLGGDESAHSATAIFNAVLDNLNATGGDLRGIGFYMSVLNAFAKVFSGRRDAELLRTKLRALKVDDDDARAFLAAVERVRTGRRVRLIPAEEVILRAPPRLLVEGVLPAESHAVLYGESGKGKTFVALDWALCIATGIPWLGHEVQQGPVVYVAAEGVGGIGKRLVAWKEARGVDHLRDFYFIDAPVNLLDAEVVSEAIETIEQVTPVLVVFDTHARSMIGGDENSAKDTGLAVDQLDRVRRATWATVLELHHTDKRGHGERGSGALRGAADAMIQLLSKDGRMSLVSDKQRNFELFPTISLRLRQVAGSVVPDLRNDDAAGQANADDDLAKRRSTIEDALRSANQRGETPLSQNKLLKLVGGNSRATTKLLQYLAGEASSPVTREKVSNGYQYDWNAPSTPPSAAVSPLKGGGETEAVEKGASELLPTDSGTGPQAA